MKVKWYGHAAFLITSGQGMKIITDPYEPGGFGGAIGYGPIPDEADIVLVTHDHGDHNYVRGLKGKPQIITGTGSHRVKNLEFEGIATYHDGSKGAERGPNTIFCFESDGLRLCHLGDLGHVPTEQEAKRIGPVALLLLPIGGVYTIDPEQGAETVRQLNPRITIPMHYKTSKCG
ncbi:MAG TPA: MBL fold metallo-hydrolase, partial [Thermodesulfobacteriota bacterium]|nr:MBL fold metallo-hydrolase [Thermodesulfobacteriota bacterium]